MAKPPTMKLDAVLALYILAVNLAGLGLTIWGIVRSDDRAQVLVYAFILDYCLRLATIYLMIAASFPKALLPLVSSPPAARQRSYPLTREETGQPVGPGGYAAVLLGLGFFAFMLVNVNAEKELDVDAATFASDLRWAIVLATFYWLQSILSRTITIEPAAAPEVNFGYNTREMTILALATLSAGALVVYRQSRGLSASGWVLLGPLLAFRFLYDLFAALQAAKNAARSGRL